MAKGRKTGGRKKGTPNKVTADERAAMQEAFRRMGDVKALSEWASDNPTEFYKLWARLIPAEQKHSGAVRVSVEYVDADD